jgi:hypothetical protein
MIGILPGANPRNPFALYLAEILAIEGFTCDWVTDRFAGDVLLVPDILLSPEQQALVEEWARLGRSLLAMRPGRALWPLFGLRGRQDLVYTRADRYLRLREGLVLQFHGAADCLEADGAEVFAWLQETTSGPPSGHPAIVRVESDGGRRAAFTYDLARSSVLFHQGRADQAGDGPNPDPDGDGMFKPNDWFVNYLDPRLKDLPQDDLHREQLVQLLYWLTERTRPLARVWRFPHAAPAVAFLTGDSDSAKPSELELAFDLTEQYGGRYTLYLMTQDYPNLAPAAVAALRERGHSVGLHPWGGPMPTVAQFREHLPREYAGFRERYGFIPATTRHHSCIEAGWVDTPAILAEIGVRMDLNPYPIRDLQSGFMTGTALPVRLCHPDGTLIDAYQQATLTSDDGVLTDKTRLPARTIDGAIDLTVRLLDDLRDRWHGVYQPCFHPIRLRDYPPPAIEWYEATLAALRDRAIPTVSGEEWVAFNDARRGVRLTPAENGWRLTSDRAVTGLTVQFPERVRGVTVRGRRHELTPCRWNGIASGWVALDLAVGEAVELRPDSEA